MKRIDFLKKTYGKKLELAKAKDTHSAHLSVDEILDKFNEADPTGNAKLMQWMILRYAANDFRVEDLTRVNKALTNFLEKRDGLENKDINFYTSLVHLEEYVDDAPVVISARKQKQKVKTEGCKVITEGEGGKVIHILTQEAATYYGKGTKWCTSGENGNMFDSYNEKGPIFLVLADDGRKFQFQLEDEQFMDETDSPVEPKWLAENYPIFDSFFNNYVHQLIAEAEEETDDEKSRETVERAAMAAVQYCSLVAQSRVPEFEFAIKKFPFAIVEYAKNVIEGDWPEGEKAIADDDWHGPICAFFYARDVLNGKLNHIHDDFVKCSGFAAKEYAKDFSNLYRKVVLEEDITT